MPATMIDGRKLAAGLRSQIAREAAAFTATGGSAPRLDVVLVGENPASQAYVGTKICLFTGWENRKCWASGFRRANWKAPAVLPVLYVAFCCQE